VQAHLGGERTRVVSLDAVGLAASAQLDAVSAILGVPHVLATTPEDLARRATGEGPATTFVDTPGVSPRDPAAVAALAGLLRSARPTEVHLVLPATTSVADGLLAARALAPLGVTRLLFTRLDEASGHGALVAVSLATELPLSYLATGRDIPNDIRPASAEELARRVLQGESPS
jgi:flagellar biosynthesis GTPase FlhF